MHYMLAAMLGTWRQQHLPEIVANLANRPGHEAVRTHVADILRYGFGVAYHEIDHEVRLPEVHGRADTLFGSVVFEFKRDLRQELSDPIIWAKGSGGPGAGFLGSRPTAPPSSPTNCARARSPRLAGTTRIGCAQR